MLTTVDYLDIANAELHRKDLQRIAIRTRRCRNATRGDDCAPVSPLQATERWRLLEAFGSSVATNREVEFADPLGVWSWGYPAPRSWFQPDWRVALDWGVWVILIVAAGYLAGPI